MTLGRIELRLSELGIELPSPAVAIANYVPFTVSGNLLVISGQLCLGPDGKLAKEGKLGGEVTLAEGQAAARACAINVLAQAKGALRSLDRVVRVVRLGGFINAQPDFVRLADVMNGASDLMVEVFGDAGRHVRSTVGVSSLPMNAAAEVEAIFEIAPDSA